MEYRISKYTILKVCSYSTDQVGSCKLYTIPIESKLVTTDYVSSVDWRIIW